MMFGAPTSQAAVPNGVGAASGGQAAGAKVIITDSLSNPHLMAAPGTTVTWVNRDDEPHRIKSDRGTNVEFDSGVLEPGDRFKQRFASASDVTYRDVRNADDPAYLGMVMIEKPTVSTTASTIAAGSGTALNATPALAPLAAPGPFVLAGDEDESTGGVNAKQVTVEIHNANEFRPATVTIAQGGTVTWYNDHSEPHTASGAGGINSGDLDRDERYSHTFDKAGTYDYVCAYHEDMQATVRVANANGKVPPPPPDNGGGTPPPPGNGGQQVAISIGSNFSPRDVTVPAGSVVTWTNNDGSPHTATGTGFDSGMLNNGQKYSHTFSKPGT
jgi:plastocyanin